MDPKPVANYIENHPELPMEARNLIREGYRLGYESRTETVDKLREGLLMMCLEIYSQQLQRGNPGIRTAVDQLVSVLEETKFD